MFGELKKLRIEAFDNPEYNGSFRDLYVVMFNPTTFNRKYEAVYFDPEGQGTTGSKRVFNKIKSQQYTFDFLIDGTGTSGSGIISKLLPEIRDVSFEVDRFLTVCGKASGDLHRPFHLKIFWSKLILKCVLDSADITYTLFKPDGTPLRAKIKALFTGSITDDLRSRLNGFSSPDLTHIRIVKEGDTLPLMADRIYGDASLYLEVARVNDLRDFRKLTVGDELIFPPINKST